MLECRAIDDPDSMLLDALDDDEDADQEYYDEDADEEAAAEDDGPTLADRVRALQVNSPWQLCILPPMHINSVHVLCCQNDE